MNCYLNFVDSSPKFTVIASLNPRIQESNSHLFGPCFSGALTFLISGWAERDREEEEVERTWVPPPHLIPRPAPERRRLRSSILPHGGARTSADAGEAAQGGSRPCECAHGCLCVSVFLYICVRAKGCLGGMYSGPTNPTYSPETGTPSVFSFYEGA